MKTISTLTKSLCCLLLIGGVASADLAINFSSTTGRGGKNPIDATAADFIAVTGTQLGTSTVLFNADPDVLGAAGNGVGGGWNFFGSDPEGGTQTNLAGSGLDVTTTGGGNGFNAETGDATDGDVILDGYIFNVQNQTLTFDGVNALANAAGPDSRIVVSAWGLGNGGGQDSDFSVTYGGATTAAQSTLFTATPVVHFDLLADGSSDSLSINVLGSGHFNAVSIAFVPATIPEPSSVALLAGSLLGIGFRRRRK